MKRKKDYRIVYKVIAIFVLIALILGAIFYQIRLAGEGETTIEANELKGQIIAVNDQTLTLRNDKNVVYTLDLQAAKIVGDEMQFGSLATISYTGDLVEGNSIQDIDVLKVSVQATQVRNGGSENTDSTVASKEIAQKVQAMTLEQKVAQMFMAICPKRDAVSLLNQYPLGGYVLTARDFENKSRETVIANIKTYQATGTIPLLIAVNEEGGDVVSVSNNLRNNPFNLPQEVFAAGGMDAIIADATEKSEFLKEFGINANLGPVVDVATSEDDYIYPRSFGSNANETSEYVKNVIEAMNSVKMGSVLKHFPGYGNAPDNSDTIYHDSRDFDTFKNNDFIPFKAGIGAGANAILVNHNVIDALDDQNPASLSPTLIKVLRNELSYQGVIMTGDLSDGGVAAFGSTGEVAKKAALAGNDMLITSNPQEHLSAVITAAQNNEICLNQIDHSVMRILTWKSQLGIL